MTIPEIHGIFVDAILTDDSDNLLFLSLWGRDTGIREFQARLTIGNQVGGLTQFNAIGKDQNNADKTLKLFARINNINSMSQLTGRIHTDILGDMVHCWLYHRDLVIPDFANHRAVIVSNTREDFKNAEALWPTIKAICPIPLLNHWGDTIIPAMQQADMIKIFDGVNQSGCKIAIDEEIMAEIVKSGCLNQSLCIDDNYPSLV